MLKVAVSASGASLDCSVPARFEDTACLLIIDADTDALLHTVAGGSVEPSRRSLFFAQKVAEFDCEALLCGELEQGPFTVIAVENCVTRYMAAGLTVLDGIHLMNSYSLDMIPDFVGGTGCPTSDHSNHSHEHTDCSNDCANCANKHDH